MSEFDRRSLLLTALSAAAAPPLLRLLSGAAEAAEAGALQLGEAVPFSFDSLVEQARARAAEPFEPRPGPSPEIVERIDYEAHGEIRYDPDLALFRKGDGIYPATLFHIGRYFQKPVAIHMVDGDTARRVAFQRGYFDMPADNPARDLEWSGFAGFRLHEAKSREDWRTQDWLAFLGASYFRAIGQLGQYGMSARGIAVDTATASGEEFPDFVAFYIEPAAEPDAPVIIHALLDGPSVAGAYRFEARRTEGVVIDVDKRLFMREGVERLGVAPLTSMFWFGEYDRGHMVDWRPEVHDSDGLAIWTGGGERVWRPLNNPPHTVVSSFADDGPRGFGLVQRDREYEHFLDGVNYHLRPSVWVEPLEPWGKGAVQLVEIPTDDEIHDNIVAFWVPEQPAEAGQALTHRYRLHWLADEPYPAAGLAEVAATRIGRGGEPGKPRPEGVDKFVVEFAGGPLDGLADDAEPKAVITAGRGKISYVFVEPVGKTGRWRAQFDLTAKGAEPVELRLYLRHDGGALTETWLYQHWPGRTGEAENREGG